MKKRVSKADIAEARKVDPTVYLEARGFRVVWDFGRVHAVIRDTYNDEIYRLTRDTRDGHFVCCDHYGGGVGKFSGGIDLVLEIEGGTFPEAVIKLLESDNQALASAWKPRSERCPSLPAIPDGPKGDAWIERGRKYLWGRGISRSVVDEAEREGFLSYGADGVFFVGRDGSGKVRNVAWRSSDPKASMSKRDLTGSSKFFPAFLRGNPDEVVLAEGGVDGLAVWQRFRSFGRTLPTVIVSSGARVSGFLENQAIRAIISKAKRIAILKDREKSEAIQTVTDAAHEKQRLKIACINPEAEVKYWVPRKFKDLAEDVLADEADLDYSSKLALADDFSLGFVSAHSLHLKIPFKISAWVMDGYNVRLRDDCALLFGHGARPGDAPTLKVSSGKVTFHDEGIREADILAGLAILSAAGDKCDLVCKGSPEFLARIKKLFAQHVGDFPNLTLSDTKVTQEAEKPSPDTKPSHKHRP